MSGAVAAIDLGATSGRVMLAHVGPNELALRQVARFPNGPVQTDDGLQWDVTGLFAAVTSGLEAAVHEEPAIASIGVDSWAVDYARMSGGRMLAEPFHYRDDRNLAAVELVHETIGARELYARNGLQQLSFNTLFQLTADRTAGALEGVDRILLVPDLFAFWFTGEEISESTNASTTGLLGVRSRAWDIDLIEKLGLDRGLFSEVVDAGTRLGALRRTLAAQIGAESRIHVTAVGSHDTASAVVAVPSTSEDFAYISCGTWGLVGVELEAPVLSEASRLANFTNEGGVDGRVRYLHNVMGLWLLTESVRSWELDGTVIDLVQLIAEATAITVPVAIFDANDERFLAPGDMPTRISRWLADRGLAVPQGRAEFVRCIIESLADAFANAVRAAGELSGRSVSVIHIVGGGSQNALLCQLTANRSGLPVLAGPVEATAIGNVLVQARTERLASGSLESLRSLVGSTFPPIRYSPR